MINKKNISILYKNKKTELLQLINKFYIIDDNLIKLLNDNLNDDVIMSYIKSNFISKKLGYDNNMANINRARTIIKYLKYSDYKKISIKNYLDIGCYNGGKTIEIGKLLHLKPNNINGIDVESFSGVKIVPLNGFNFHTYKNDKNNRLPFNDNSFEFITVLQVLHHIKKPLSILKEISRVLKPNGLLFIREHDCLDKYDSKLIKLEHLLYTLLVDNVSYEVYAKDNYEKYFSRETLVNKLKELGFNLLKQKVDNFDTKKKINPTRYYNIIFQLIK